MLLYYLGVREAEKGKSDRAMRHFFIAAKLGDDIAMGNVKKGYELGLVLKDEFCATLRAHQDAVDATKSPQREAAAAARHQEHWRSTHVEDGRRLRYKKLFTSTRGEKQEIYTYTPCLYLLLIELSKGSDELTALRLRQHGEGES
eukprot:scaffold23165_cov83-Skeletonema_dohrnii-CCMP3373.AAC.3